MAGILRGEIRWADLSPTRGQEQARQRPKPRQGGGQFAIGEGQLFPGRQRRLVMAEA